MGAYYSIPNDGTYAINLNIASMRTDTQYDTNRSSTQPVCINSCGCNYYSLNSNPIKISRPDGRADYQFIYIQDGKGIFSFCGQEKILGKGTLILYKPGEPQHYYYDTTCNTRAYWIHFSGSEIETLLRQNNLWDHQVYFIDAKIAFSEIITKIIRELQFHAYNYSLNCHAYFLELICLLSRALNQQNSLISLDQEMLVPALNVLHNHYQIDHEMKELAGLCGMSVSHFIRTFKKYTGFPPHQYMTMVRIAHAKNLLLQDCYAIAEAAQMVGYENPLYFGRIFKKYTGVTPSDFKKGNMV